MSLAVKRRVGRRLVLGIQRLREGRAGRMASKNVRMRHSSARSGVSRLGRATMHKGVS